jgi:hypothetical protein
MKNNRWLIRCLEKYEMPRYRVSGTVISGAIIASKYLGEFEVGTEEEAIEMALSSENAYLRHARILIAQTDFCDCCGIHDASAELIEESIEQPQ